MVVPVSVVTTVALLTALRRPLWLDEAYTLAATNDLLTALRAARGSMGLYYLLIAVWGQAGDSTLWLRLPSILATGAAVGVFTILAARQHGRAVARWAALGVALSYLVIRYAEEARSYAVVSLLTVVAWAALDRLVERPEDRRIFAVYVTCCGALPLLHGLAAIQVLMQAAVLLLAGVGGLARRRAAAGIVLGMLTTLAVLAVGAGSSGNWLPPMTIDSARRLATTLVVPQEWIGTLVTMVLILGSVLLLRRAAHGAPGLDRFRALLPVAWGPASVLVLLAISTVRPSQLPRYASPSVFGLVLVLALTARAADRWLAGRPGAAALPLASLAMVLVVGIGAVLVVADQGQAWPEAAQLVADRAEPGDRIVFPTSDARLPFDAAWRDLSPAATPAVVAVSAELGSARREVEPAPVSELAAEMQGAPRVWVVLQPYMHVDNPDITAQPSVQEDFIEVGTWDLGSGIEVHLLEARSH